MTHTPEPWAQHGKGGCPCGQIFGPDRNVLVAIVQGPMHLNDVEGPDSVPSESFQKANAALIVRAVNCHTELVAALRWITERDGECLADHPDILAKFRAVLAKADA